MLARLGVEVREIRLPEDLDGLDGLIIPGGESTTIGKLAVDFNLMEPLIAFGKHKAIWGTCAGAIFLSKDARRQQPLLGLMDIAVERNAFGRQVESFEVDLDVPVLNLWTQTTRRCTPFLSELHSSRRCPETPRRWLAWRTGAWWRRRKANYWLPPSTRN